VDPTSLTVEDRLDIAELAARYANIVDDREWPRLAEVFTPDAVLTITGLPEGDVRCAGLDAIAAYMEERSKERPYPVSHHITNVEPRVDGEIVRVRAKVIGAGVTGRVGTGNYDDEFRRTVDGWRIAAKRLSLNLGD
jgi:3-phenylpropionate/cinnamic acid dioxygenase small subunit